MQDGRENSLKITRMRRLDVQYNRLIDDVDKQIEWNGFNSAVNLISPLTRRRLRQLKKSLIGSIGTYFGCFQCLALSHTSINRL